MQYSTAFRSHRQRFLAEGFCCPLRSKSGRTLQAEENIIAIAKTMFALNKLRKPLSVTVQTDPNVP